MRPANKYFSWLLLILFDYLLMPSILIHEFHGHENTHCLPGANVGFGKLHILLIIFLLCTNISSFSQAILTGKVTDAATGESLPGATLFIPDLKTGAAIDKDGVYHFTNLPKSTLLIQATYIGYGSKSTMVDLKTTTTLDFRLSEKAVEAQEVVITGSGISTDNSRSSITITPIGKAELLTTPSTNIIDAISAVPGLSQITTGGDISKPVIRGLSYSHVVTLNEGVRQEGQQWGDQHSRAYSCTDEHHPQGGCKPVCNQQHDDQQYIYAGR